MTRPQFSSCLTRLGNVRSNLFTGRRLRQSLVIAAGAVSLVAGAASAADLPTRKAPVAPVYIPPAFTWTGFYVGLNAGGAWANRNNNNDNVLPLGAIPVGGFVPLAVSGHNGSASGFIGGAQAGYNYQFTPGQGFVVGLETDIDWADLGRNNNNGAAVAFTLPQFPGTIFTSTANSRNNNSNQYLGTVRLRAGYAWDRFLLFATGGLAYGGVNNNGNGLGLVAVTAAGSPLPLTGVIAPTTTITPIGGLAGNRSSSTKAGWTLGGGVEYALWSNFSIKAEYLYANFGNNNRNASGFFLPGVASAFNNRSRSLDVNIFRVGINYKFW